MSLEATMTAGLLRRARRHERLLRFAITGGLATAVQMGVLTLLAPRIGHADLADLAGFLVSAQVNFVLSATFTWRDRRRPGAAIAGHWLRFHLSIAAMAVVNLATFAAVHPLTGAAVAAAAGIGAAAAGNFVLGDRLVFPAAIDGTRPGAGDRRGTGGPSCGLGLLAVRGRETTLMSSMSTDTPRHGGAAPPGAGEVACARR
jgi:putative flippase GtrA